MPQTEVKTIDSRTSDSPAHISTLWQKFHFSGRVIMCSVLFGLGLILIGGLIFAINVDDDDKNLEKKDENADALPTKAPSNYVGPVVMGIGGFIVIVGVIMCLFETQVCRKKTADSKPLISDKNEDVEAKTTDSSQIPSTSHYHKNHKHKSRKVSSSPRKTKIKHTKSHSHEEKLTSSKSPPIAIDKSKNFMTSSEENFLTPPNTLSEHAALGQRNSREAEIQTSSSLMKSFTSSGTWTKSTEFLTPTASYKGNSSSLDNSVELDETQGEESPKKNEVSVLKNTHPEYMTPLTSEAEKIQEMLAQVRNEKMKTDQEPSQEKRSTKDIRSEHRNDTTLINPEGEIIKNEGIKISVGDHSIDANSDILVDKTVIKKPAEGLSGSSEKSKDVSEEHAFSDNFSSISNTSAAEFIDNKIEAMPEESSLIAHAYHDEDEEINIKAIPSLHKSVNEKTESFLLHDSSMSHLNEAKNIPEIELGPSNETNCENDNHNNLESSLSSEETLVSHDNSIEKVKSNDDQLPISLVQEVCCDTSKKIDASESQQDNQCSSNSGMNDNQNSQIESVKAEKVGASDLTNKENDSKEAKNIDEKSNDEFS